jgi:hypothetical protein
MMKKDKTIIEFIKNLEQTIDINLVEIIDYWDADLCSIGIKKDMKLIYINTYNSTLSERIYDYDLEILTKRIDDFKVIKEVRGAKEIELFVEIKHFFEL